MVIDLDMKDDSNVSLSIVYLLHVVGTVLSYTNGNSCNCMGITMGMKGSCYCMAMKNRASFSLQKEHFASAFIGCLNFYEVRSTCYNITVNSERVCMKGVRVKCHRHIAT